MRHCSIDWRKHDGRACVIDGYGGIIMTTLRGVRCILLNHFGHRMTERCVRSLRMESLDRLYLVDNSADEAEFERLSAVVEKIEREGVTFGIELLRNDRNLGFGCAINKVISLDRRQARAADAYLLLNNDTQVAPGMVSALVSALQKQPNVRLAAPGVVTDGVTGCYRWYNRLSGHVSDTPFPFSFRYLTACCLLVSARLVGKGELFDEDFFMYGEDVLLNWQTERKGGAVVCVQEASVEHAVAGSSVKGADFYEYHVGRGHVLLAWKLARGTWEVPFLVIGRLIYLPLRAIVRSLRYRSWAPVRMLWRACLGRAPEC